MSTPNDALYAALGARPQQTADELAHALTAAGYRGLGPADVELLLQRDPRLRNDGGTPPRWRALGAAHPVAGPHTPRPHQPAPAVLAPAASFGDRAPARAPEPPAGPAPAFGQHRILPAAAFAGRPSVQLQERATATPAAPPLPVRVPVIPRVATPPATAQVWVPATMPAREVPAPRPETVVVAEAVGPVAPIPVAEPAPVVAPAPLVERVPAIAPVAPVERRTVVPVPVVAPAADVAASPVFAPVEVVEPVRVAALVAEPVAPAEPVRIAEPLPVAAVPAIEPVRTSEPPSVVVAPSPVPAAEPVPDIAPAAVAELLPVAPTPVPPAVERGPLPPGGEVRYVGPQLRRWQKDVLDAWLATDRRGIVEAVSAQGRGIVGVLAAWDALTRGEKVLVLVPTADLMEQWFSTFEIDLPGLSLGRRGDGWEHGFDDCDVLVSLVSAAFGNDLLQGRPGLLIADEVHKYGSARPAETLRTQFGARLGLTTAVERMDPGVDQVLLPYFGSVLDGCGLRRGRKEGVLAQFRVALVPVDLDEAAQVEHDALSAQIDELAGRLTRVHGCRPGAFLEDVKTLQGRWQENSTAATDASAYLRAVSTRRDLLATSTAKLDALVRLSPTVARSTHAVVFTHTKDDAESAALRLRTAGVAADVVHHGLETRRSSLRSFRDGTLKALTAPKILDEGIDLPPVDVIVVLAGSRSARQSVQRTSPILRPTQADRLPALVVVYARGTVDDPTLDTAEGHLEELVSVATEVRAFDTTSSGAAVAAWFVGA